MTSGSAVAGADAVTFDVFDTALTRCWALPSHLFLRCAELLRDAGLHALDDISWMSLRQRCEKAATQRCGEGLARLEDIYAELGAALAWTPAQIERAMDIEMACEIESARPVPAIAALWSALRSSGRRQRFLSDMYLAEPQVTRLLRGAGYRVEPDDVWVSAARGATKRAGGLFSLALSAWPGIDPSRVIHLGDNMTADVEQARKAGLVVRHRTDTRLPRTAQAVLDLPAPPLRLRSLVAGAIRTAGLHAGESHADPREAALWKLGSGHAGPLLGLYVWWILLDAQARGVQRLYFLARDGQVLLEVARALQEGGCAPHIDLRYLHASRQAWFAPSVREWDVASLFRVLDEPDRLASPSKLARRLGFADEEGLRALWPQLLERLAPATSNRQLAEHLARDVPAAEGLRHTEALRELAVAYLRQQGLDDTTEWAIVDLGWRGRLQRALSQILGAGGTERHVRGYYMRLEASPQGRGPAWQVHTLCEAGAPLGPAHLIELLCEADHGSTQGYERDAAGTVCARFAPRSDDRVQAWGLPTYRRGVLAFAAELASVLPLLGTQSPSRHDLHAMARTAGRELFGRPPADVARVFAGMPCSYSVDHDDVGPLASPLNRADACLRALSLGRLRLGRAPGHWLAGSLAVSQPERAYEVYVLLHRAGDRLRHASRRGR